MLGFVLHYVMLINVRACVRAHVRACVKVQSHVIISCKLTKQLTQGKDILTMAMNDQSMSINALRDIYSMAVNTFQPLVAGRHASRVNKCVTVG
eukprot:jgi/Botrbrau1/23000/Bobra.0030s0064.1